jgi:peptidoglycan/xylan/chitin deacetylase (PgdA/CDA1 family)
MLLRFLKLKYYRVLIQLLWLLYKSKDNTHNRVPVLCYHRFLPHFDEINSPLLYVTPEQFEIHMSFLSENGFKSLSLDEYISVAAGETIPSPRSVLVTIDDGYYDAYAVAWPIAQKYNVKLNLFILTGVQETPGPFFMGIETEQAEMHSEIYPELWRPLSWNDLREMNNS